jgi:hypothetical protein
LVPEIVDAVLHHLLWTFEQNEHIRIAMDLADEQVESLNAISDGLPGELYSDEGWIARFSKEPNPWLSAP